MTQYNPIIDAQKEGASEPTVQDLIDAGYDDFEIDGKDGIVNAALRIAVAINEMGGLSGDDSAKWYAVNELVAALRVLEQESGAEISIIREVETRTVDPKERWGRDGEPFDVEVPSISVRARK